MTRSERGLRPFLLAILAAAAGCAGPQRMLSPDGPGAARIAELWWILLAATAIPATLTIAVIVLVAVRRRSAPRPPDARRENRVILLVGGLVPAAIVIALAVSSFRYGRSAALPFQAPDLTVRVVGHQFWWQVVYPDGTVTANEIHVPVGRTVRLELESADVIHSFWVPELHGKMDMIPGRTNRFWIHADRAGVYRGQCAEFCGIQHAQMAFLVIAEPEAEFEAWLARTARPATLPDDAEALRGVAVFERAGCASCHAVRGVFEQAPAGGVGPDLTHVAARRTIAAGSLPATPEALRAFVLDPHARKPGVRMPATPLPPEDLEALGLFLERLR